MAKSPKPKGDKIIKDFDGSNSPSDFTIPPIGIEDMDRAIFELFDGIFDDFNQGRTTAFTGLSSGFSFQVPISGETNFSLDYSFRPANPLSSVHTVGARIGL